MTQPSVLLAGRSLTVRPANSASQWNAALAALPAAHVLQSWEWGEFKRSVGWQPERLLFGQADGGVVAAASAQLRALPLPGWTIAYVPKGPAMDYQDDELVTTVAQALAEYTRRTRAVFLTIDPDVESPAPGVAAALAGAGFRPAETQVQMRNTLVVDLRGTEAQVLERMHHTWRRHIRNAMRRGVVVRKGDGPADLNAFYELYRLTSQRQRFIIRPKAYYRDALEALAGGRYAQLLLADVEGSPVAGLVAYRFARRAWYFYGAWSGEHSNRAPNHILQWEAMRWARSHGCDYYDLWGAPEALDQDHPLWGASVSDLLKMSTPPGPDPMWGVYQFKRGFGARPVRWLGAWEYVASPRLFRVWSKALPRYLDALRRLRGETHLAQSGGGEV